MADIITILIRSILTRYFGPDTEPTALRPVHGGDINEAWLAVLADGRKIFLKMNARDKEGFFKAERKGLEAIRKTKTIKVPVLLTEGVSDKSAYLMMEYLEAGPKKADYWEQFGRQLAVMHRADPSEWTPGGQYGFPEDNYIGAGEQVNRIQDSWLDFFRECRLEVQFKRAVHPVNHKVKADKHYKYRNDRRN